MKNAVFIFTFLFSVLASAEITDDNLNAMYKKALANTNEDQHLNHALKQSQRDWLKYRESQCNLTAGTYHIYTEEHEANKADCIKSFNKERTDFLNKSESLN